MSGGPDFDTLEAAAEAKYGLPRGILRTTRIVETAGGHDVPGKPTKYGTAQGFYQTMPANVQKYRFNPHDPAQAVDGTARLWADNLKAAGGNVQEAARMYNGSGPEARAYSQHWMHVYGGASTPASAPSFTLGGDDEPAAPAAAPSFTLGGDEPAPQAADPAQPAPPPAAAPADAPADAAPKDAAKLEKDFVTGGLPSAAPGDGKAAPHDEYTAALNHIAPHATPADVVRLAQNYGFAVKPEDAKAALTDFHAGRPTTLRDMALNPTPAASPGYAADAGQGLLQSARDMANLPGDAAAWADKNIPGVQGLDNMLARATGVQGDAVGQSDVSHAITGAFGVGPYGQSWTGSGTRLAGDIAGSVAMGGPIEAGAARLAGTALAPDALAFAAGRGGSNLLTRGASLATRGATSGAMYGGLNEGSNNDGLGQNMLTGAITGAIAAPVLGGVASGAHRLMGGAISPETAALAQTAADHGITIDPAQLNPGSPAKKLYSLLEQMPGTGMTGRAELQRGQVMQAVADSIGAKSPNLTPEVLDAARRDAGQRMGAIADKTTISDPTQLLADLDDIQNTAKLHVPADERTPLDGNIENIREIIANNGGTLPGNVYQNITGHSSGLSRLASGRTTAASSAQDVQDALHSALREHAEPGDVEAFDRARGDYKKVMTLEPLLRNSTDGTFNPTSLQGVVSRSYKNRAFTGAGDLGDIGSVAKHFLGSARSSGTTENTLIAKAILKSGKVAGAGLAGAMGYGAAHGLFPSIEEMVPTLLAGGGALGIARTAGKVLTNPASTNRLVAAALNDNGTSAALPGLIRLGVPAAVTQRNRLRAAASPK